MTIADDIPVMTTDSDWLDLREGEEIIVQGRLSAAVRKGSRSVMIDMPDWSSMVIELDDASDREIERGTRVRIKAARTEDGLQAAVADIAIQEGNHPS